MSSSDTTSKDLVVDVRGYICTWNPVDGFKGPRRITAQAVLAIKHQVEIAIGEQNVVPGETQLGAAQALFADDGDARIIEAQPAVIKWFNLNHPLAMEPTERTEASAIHVHFEPNEHGLATGTSRVPLR